MNAPGFFSPDLAIRAEFQTRFDTQRGAFLKAPEPSHAERLADLKALARLLKENQSAIIAAIDADYGGRSGRRLGRHHAKCQQHLNGDARSSGFPHRRFRPRPSAPPFGTSPPPAWPRRPGSASGHFSRE